MTHSHDRAHACSALHSACSRPSTHLVPPQVYLRGQLGHHPPIHRHLALRNQIICGAPRRDPRRRTGLRSRAAGRSTGGRAWAGDHAGAQCSSSPLHPPKVSCLPLAGPGAQQQQQQQSALPFPPTLLSRCFSLAGLSPGCRTRPPPLRPPALPPRPRPRPPRPALGLRRWGLDARSVDCPSPKPVACARSNGRVCGRGTRTAAVAAACGVARGGCRNAPPAERTLAILNASLSQLASSGMKGRERGGARKSKAGTLVATPRWLPVPFHALGKCLRVSEAGGHNACMHCRSVLRLVNSTCSSKVAAEPSLSHSSPACTLATWSRAPANMIATAATLRLAPAR